MNLLIKLLKWYFKVYIVNIFTIIQRSSAAEACWAHNPEVDGSTPFFATFYEFLHFSMIFSITIIKYKHSGPMNIILLQSKK